MASLRRNVAVPSGDIYPNGVPPVALNGDVQATVRPAGLFFRKSVGYESIRPGRHQFQSAYHGLGIHFTPMRFAEDVGEFDSLPLLVDEETSARHADIAELPGSDRLDDGGRLSDEDTNANRGVKLAETAKAAHTGGPNLHAGNRTAIDMGDRDPSRPLTKAAYGLLHNPVSAFRTEYQQNPLTAVAVAGAIVGAIYYVTREFESSYRRRNTGGPVAAVGTVPAAAVATTGEAVKDTTSVANDAVSAAGDTVEAAGKAVETVTDAAADAVSSD